MDIRKIKQEGCTDTQEELYRRAYRKAQGTETRRNTSRHIIIINKEAGEYTKERYLSISP